MMDLIPGMTFTDSDKQIYGSVAAALLGALVGTLATYFTANRERKKQDELSKIRINREYIHDNSKGLQSAEITITDLLIKCEANNEYVTDIKKGLIKRDGEKTLALMQLSTPFNYPLPAKDITQQILNDRIVTLWANLCQEIELQNKNISDFADYYRVLFSTIHTSLLKGEKLDMSVVRSDNKTIGKGMDQQLNANKYLRNKCITLLAHIDCFKNHIKENDPRKLISLEEYRTFIDTVAKYEPSPIELDKAKESEEKIYNPKVMFKSESTGS